SRACPTRAISPTCRTHSASATHCNAASVPPRCCSPHRTCSHRAACPVATQSASIFPGITAAAPAIRRSSMRSNPSRKRAQRGDAMNEHLKPQSISQQADELEEHMMHELERVVTKSTLHYLAEGKVAMDSSADLWKKHP